MFMDIICDCCDAKLKRDEACIAFTNSGLQKLDVYAQYRECHHCSLEKLESLEPGEKLNYVVSTWYKIKFALTSNNLTCFHSKEFKEHYHYLWNINLTLGDCTEPTRIVSASSAYMPLQILITLVGVATILYLLLSLLYKNTKDSQLWWCSRFQKWNAPEAEITENAVKGNIPIRINSVDVFRGLCVLLAVFMEMGGGGYKFFAYSDWNGLTIADLMFPWFMFLMGISLTLSLNSKLKMKHKRFNLFVHVIKRFLILLLLGLITSQTSNDIELLKYSGNLQVFAFAYLIVGLVETAFFRVIHEDQLKNVSCLIPELAFSVPQWIMKALLISANVSITFFMYVPGCGSGYVGPGGLHLGGAYYNCTGGGAGYVDRQLFKCSQIENKRRNIYCAPYNTDETNAIGILSSAIIVAFGSHCAKTIMGYKSIRIVATRLILCGLALCGIGGILSGFSKDTGLIPINRYLVSLSFVFVTGGAAFIVTTLFHIVVDVLKILDLTLFRFPGMNPLAVYVIHNLIKYKFPFGWQPHNDSSHVECVILATWSTFIFWCLSYCLYKHKLFLRA